MNTLPAPLTTKQSDSSHKFCPLVRFSVSLESTRSRSPCPGQRYVLRGCWGWRCDLLVGPARSVPCALEELHSGPTATKQQLQQALASKWEPSGSWWRGLVDSSHAKALVGVQGGGAVDTHSGRRTSSGIESFRHVGSPSVCWCWRRVSSLATRTLASMSAPSSVGTKNVREVRELQFAKDGSKYAGQALEGYTGTLPYGPVEHPHMHAHARRPRRRPKSQRVSHSGVSSPPPGTA